MARVAHDLRQLNVPAEIATAWHSVCESIEHRSKPSMQKGLKEVLEVAEQQVEELQSHFKNKEDQRRCHLQQLEEHLLAAEKELEILERMAVEDSTASRSEAREWLETGKLSKVPDAVAMSDSESDTLDDTSDIAPIEWPKEEPQISPMCIVDSVPEVLPLTLHNPGASGPMIGQALPVETNEPGTGSKLFWAHLIRDPRPVCSEEYSDYLDRTEFEKLLSAQKTAALLDALSAIQQDSCLLGGLAAGERRIFGASLCGLFR